MSSDDPQFLNLISSTDSTCLDPGYSGFRDFEQENLEKLQCFLRRKDAAVLIHPLLDQGFGKFIAVNQTAVDRYGYSREELLEMTAADLTNPQDSVRHASRSNRSLIRQKRHLLMRSEHLSKSGRVIPVEIDATVIPHLGRDMILAVVRDLTEQRNTERALAESQVRFRSILEKSADPMYLASVDGRFLDVNEAASVAMGFTREEFLEMNIGDLDPVSGKFDFAEQWDQVVRDKRLIIETVHQKKDGTIIPVEVHIAAFLENGQKVLLGTARDISERKEQERKLTESEYRFRALLQSVRTLAVQGYHPDGSIFFWNPANESIYGYAPEEAIGKNLVDLIIPDEMKDGVRSVISEAGRTGKMPEAGELYLERKDGSRVWVYSSHVAVKIGEAYELYCLDVDLSANKEAERQKEMFMHDLFEAKEIAEQANKAKDDFLAVMSHEMRTPLNPIVGFASLMLDDCRPDQKEFLQSILSSSNRMLNLVEDILDFARFERGDQRLKPSRNDLINMCHLALEDVRDLGGHLDLKFENGFAGYDAVPENLEAEYDYHGLLRVLDNLLTNACKYTKKGSIYFQVGSRGPITRDGNATLVFQVCDTGIGIPEKYLERLFEPFLQVDSSYTRSHGGVGLGLAVCKKLVNLMGGNITVESLEGKGSCFRVEITTPVFCEEKSPLESARLQSQSRLSPDVRILLVEDQEDNLRMTQLLIQKWGGHCEAVASGMGAIQCCKQQDFDIILMDLGMPEMDGLETTRIIRGLENRSARARIVALTADTGGDVQERCNRAGMDAYLAKPLQVSLLMDTINKFSSETGR